MKNNVPLVSVYIPTHNRSELLLRAINSVLAQTYPKIEILICSDASTDNTDQMMADLMKEHCNIYFFKNEVAKGACAARNVCIKAASGEYITGLDDDDIFHPQRVEILQALYSHDDAFICSILSEKDLGLTNELVLFPIIPKVHRTEAITLDDVLFDNVIGNQVFTELDKLKAIGGFCEEMPAWQDYDTWVRLMVKYGAGRKVRTALYIADIDRTRTRITNSSRRVLGCNKFYQRYMPLMTTLQLKNARLRQAIYANQKLSVMALCRNINIKGFKNWLRAVALKLGHKF